INHGNSGGPLIDVATNTVIGINDQIAAGTVDANVGIGFAAPINVVRTSANTLIAGGTPQHAGLGVGTFDATTSSARSGKGYAGSPAAKAGVKVGDVVTAYNGKTVLNWGSLTSYANQSQVGDKVTLTIRRGSKTLQLTLTLINRPDTLQ